LCSKETNKQSNIQTGHDSDGFFLLQYYVNLFQSFQFHVITTLRKELQLSIFPVENKFPKIFVKK